MKNKSTTEESKNQIVEYLTKAAAHGGYCWDGVRIDSGTAVTCMKTIANATGLSYYRVKKMYRAARLGRLHHCCAPQVFRYNHFLCRSGAWWPTEAGESRCAGYSTCI